MQHDFGTYGHPEVWSQPQPQPDPLPEVGLASSGSDTPAPAPVPAPAPAPVPAPAPGDGGGGDSGDGGGGDSEDNRSWFRKNMIDAIVIIVCSVFIFMTLILLATSYRTYRRATAMMGDMSGPMPRPLRGRRTAARLGVPQVFAASNLERLRYLGDMPRIPPVMMPRYASRYRGMRRTVY